MLLSSYLHTYWQLNAVLHAYCCTAPPRNNQPPGVELKPLFEAAARVLALVNLTR